LPAPPPPGNSPASQWVDDRLRHVHAVPPLVRSAENAPSAPNQHQDLGPSGSRDRSSAGARRGRFGRQSAETTTWLLPVERRCPPARIRCAGPLTEDTAQAIAVPGDPPVGSIRRSRERPHEQGDRRTGRQQPCQVRDGPTAGVGAAIGRHEMPGRHLPLGSHPLKKVVGLRALERDRSEGAVAIPGEDLGKRPPAQPAVIVEEDRRPLHAHRVEEDRHLVRHPACSSTRKRSKDSRVAPGPRRGPPFRSCRRGHEVEAGNERVGRSLVDSDRPSRCSTLAPPCDRHTECATMRA
jgi:hypothetical protein